MKTMKIKRIIRPALIPLTAFALCACGSSSNQSEASASADPVITPEAVPAEEYPKEEITVVCFGDSNTWGFDGDTWDRFDRTIRWPSVLQKQLGETYTVVAEGLNSRTIKDHGQRNYPYEAGINHIEGAIKTSKPVDYLVIMLGTNDCKFTYNLSSEEIASDMDEFLTLAENTCKEVQGNIPTMILIAPPAISDQLEGTSFADEFDITSHNKSIELADLYESLANKHHCLFLKATDELEVTPTDGIHITAESHVKLAAMVYEVLKAN